VSASAAETAASRARYAHLVEVCRAHPLVSDQADELGITQHALRVLKCRARRAGFDVDPAGVRRRESSKWADVEREMQGPGCELCGLHGAHFCVKLDDYVNARPGDGPTLPDALWGEHAGKSKKRGRDIRENVDRAAIRIGMDRRRLADLVRSAGYPKPRVGRWRLKPEVYDAIVAAAKGRRRVA